ncbi:MAG: hypothetical protein R3C60_08040 [Parvularculaceae bacterium]
MIICRPSLTGGLNQYLTAALATPTYDNRGNMTADGSGKTFGYDAANRLTSVSGSVSAALSYDPAGSAGGNGKSAGKDA